MSQRKSIKWSSFNWLVTVETVPEMPVKMLRISTAASGHLGVRLIETIAASGTLHPTIQTLYSPRILLLQQIRVEARQVRNLFRLLLGLLIRARRLFTSPTTTTTPTATDYVSQGGRQLDLLLTISWLTLLHLLTRYVIFILSNRNVIEINYITDCIW